MRQPVLGRVKTRLARETDSLAAWQFYRRASRRLLRRLRADPSWQVVVAWASAPEPQALFRPGDLLQGSGDIGERMERCLRAVPPGPVVLLGADIPGVRPRHIRRAFACLRHTPLVFGPARDGGFWLAGARNPVYLQRPLFAAGIRWSSPQTLADVLAGLRQPVGLADTLADVDHAADLPPPASLTGFPGFQ
jgi:glycosyltransferase A (GT-A) superfamily protein (DUF2064 family)